MERIGLILAGGALILSAQEAAPAPRPWTDVATLSFVATGGNAEGQTIGFANDFGYKWRLSALTVKAGAIRVSTTTVARSATGTSLDDAVVTETRTRTTTAEAYTLQSRLDHRFREDGRFYAFGAAGWERLHLWHPQLVHKVLLTIEVAGLDDVVVCHDETPYPDAGESDGHRAAQTARPRDAHTGSL